MNIIAVDDERPALRILEKAILEAVPNCSLTSFQAAEAAVDHAKETTIDIAFLDIHMAGMTGMELAAAIKKIHPKANILFVTGYGEYALEAFSMGASGYIVKPPDPEAITIELSRLRNPVPENTDKKVRIKCFNGFGVFINEEPFLISWNKPKELLAYLVHKEGAGISTAEIAAVLWEDKEYNQSTRNQTQRVISQLTKLLDGAGIGHIIKRDWNSLAVDINMFSCDYYEHLKSDNDFLAKNAGEYLIEYAWAEPTAGYLSFPK